MESSKLQVDQGRRVAFRPANVACRRKLIRQEQRLAVDLVGGSSRTGRQSRGDVPAQWVDRVSWGIQRGALRPLPGGCNRYRRKPATIGGTKQDSFRSDTKRETAR